MQCLLILQINDDYDYDYDGMKRIEIGPAMGDQLSSLHACMRDADASHPDRQPRPHAAAMAVRTCSSRDTLAISCHHVNRWGSTDRDTRRRGELGSIA
jgi:hypothetical protein